MKRTADAGTYLYIVSILFLPTVGRSLFVDALFLSLQDHSRACRVEHQPIIKGHRAYALCRELCGQGPSGDVRTVFYRELFVIPAGSLWIDFRYLLKIPIE